MKRLRHPGDPGSYDGALDPFTGDEEDSESWDPSDSDVWIDLLPVPPGGTGRRCGTTGTPPSEPSGRASALLERKNPAEKEYGLFLEEWDALVAEGLLGGAEGRGGLPVPLGKREAEEAMKILLLGMSTEPAGP